MSKKILDKIKYIKEFLSKAIDDDYDYEDVDGMSVVDDPNANEDDAAEAWLKEQEGKQSKPVQQEDKKRSRVKKWSPRDDYSDAHREEMQKLMSEGYSHREASRIAGAHSERGEHMPDMPSDKMLEMLRPYAKAVMSKRQRFDDLDADEASSPIKALRGKKSDAADKHYGSLNEAMSAHEKELESQGMDEDDIADAMDEFRAKWHEDNPEHISNSANHMKDHTAMHEKTYRKIPENFAEQEKRIAGIGMDAGSGLSDAAAMQHAGISISDSGISGGGVDKSPEQRFAESNPEYVKQLQEKHAKGQNLDKYKHLMSEEQKGRHTRLRGANARKTNKPNKAFTEE